MPYAPKTHMQRVRQTEPYKAIQRAVDRERKRKDNFTGSRRWRKFRQWVLSGRPLCEHPDCVNRPATDVHHLIDRRVRAVRSSFQRRLPPADQAVVACELHQHGGDAVAAHAGAVFAMPVGHADDVSVEVGDFHSLALGLGMGATPGKATKLPALIQALVSAPRTSRSEVLSHRSNACASPGRAVDLATRSRVSRCR